MTRCVQSFSVPAELMFLEEQPYLLLEERWRDFEALRRVMIEEVQKQKFEWLWLWTLSTAHGKIPLVPPEQRILNSCRETGIASGRISLSGSQQNPAWRCHFIWGRLRRPCKRPSTPHTRSTRETCC
jgi:hypothetical protein